MRIRRIFPPLAIAAGLVAAGLPGPAHTAAAPPGPAALSGGESVPGQLLVGYRPGVSDAARAAMHRHHGARVLQSFPQIAEVLKARDQGVFLPRTPVYNELADAVHRAVQRVMLNNADIQATLNEAAAEVDRATASARG